MDETTTISSRHRAIVVAVAALVVVLAMLRPTPELRYAGHGVNAVPVEASPLSGIAARQP